MSDIQSGSKDLLDTTDCLEAVGVFKGWKNFFFIIVVLCLALQQASFWVVDREYIAVSGETDTLTETELTPTDEATEPNLVEPNLVEPNLPEPQPLEVLEPNLPVDLEKVMDSNEAEPNDVSGFSSFDSRIQRAVAWPSGSFLSGIGFERLACLIRFVNALLILSATLYCLTLLFGLKVSMHGRLGGINHVSRAFFLSLILLVLLLPWQMVFGNFVVGAIFSPEELAQWYSKEAENVFDLVLYYIRFCGFGVLIFLLLILAQVRSVRWAKAILRRLEII